MPTLGDEINKAADLSTKAHWLIQKVTQEYLEQQLDSDAKSYWARFRAHTSNSLFMRRFFEKYANVFSSAKTENMWVCCNPSAAATATLRELELDQRRGAMKSKQSLGSRKGKRSLSSEGRSGMIN